MERGGPSFGCIVVGTDGSATAAEAVARAAEIAAASGGTLEIVSAYEPQSQQRLRMESRGMPPDPQWEVNQREDVDETLRAAAAVARDHGVEARTYARQGDPADAILDVAEEHGADLVVVGNRGLTGARRFLLGSVPSRVSQHAPCSVLIVRTS